MALAKSSEIEGRIGDAGRIVAVTARYGLKLANDDEIRAGRGIAAKLIGDGIATTETFTTMQMLTHASVFVFCESGAVTGMLGMFLLNERGLRAIEGGSFDAITPDRGFVCEPGDAPAACYGWGFAATTEAGGRAAVKAAVALHDELFWAMPTFTRTATPDGVRVIRGSMGYQCFRDDDPGLAWIPPATTKPGAIAR